MSYYVGKHFEKFIRGQVAAGRYNNASEVVRNALRLLEESELKHKALKEHIERAFGNEGVYHTDDDVEKILLV